jgi:hypothetical protein
LSDDESVFRTPLPPKATATATIAAEVGENSSSTRSSRTHYGGSSRKSYLQTSAKTKLEHMKKELLKQSQSDVVEDPLLLKLTNYHDQYVFFFIFFFTSVLFMYVFDMTMVLVS